MSEGRNDTKGRTHDPTLRELTSELDGLRDLLEARFTAIEIMAAERDRVYKERDVDRRLAVETAIAASRELTRQSFEASEKAIVKAEDAQRAYNASHNDLSRKMDDQYKTMLPHSEARLKWESFEKEIAELRREKNVNRETVIRDLALLRENLSKDIASLRESRSEIAGKQTGSSAAWGYIVTAIMVGSTLIAFAIGLVRFGRG